MLRHLLTSSARTSIRSLYGKSKAFSAFLSSHSTPRHSKDRTDNYIPKAILMIAAGAGLASALCLTVDCRDDKTSDQSSEVASSPHSTPSQPPSSMEKEDPLEESDTVFIDSGVIMLTHNLPVTNPENGKCVETTVFFENGAHNSLISEDLARLLKLEPIDQYQYEFRDFGKHEFSFTSYVYVVQLMQKNGELVDLVVHSIPSMEDTLVMSGVATEDYDDPNPMRHVVTPGIVIGSDRFWDFVNSKGPLLPSGLWSINTVFGRMVTGLITTTTTSKPLNSPITLN